MSGSAAPDGRRLAARWQIERTRRPAGTDLVWLGFAKPEVARFACLACGDAGLKQGVLRASGRTFHLCAACGTHQAHPPAGPPALDDFARRLAIEHDADIAAAARTAAWAMRGRGGGRLLDLGCRLGLVVDIVNRRAGWRAAGVDPGPLAALGAACLDAPVREGGPGHAAASAAVPADVVLCEDLLDRCADPLGMLRALPALSSPRATWLIAARDAALLYELDTAEAILELAQPSRTLILSEPGLRALLRRSTHVDLAIAPIVHDAGVLRIAVTGRGHARADTEVDEDAVLAAYLAARLAAPAASPAFDVALRVLALQRALDQRRLDDAHALLDALAPALRAAEEAARTRAERVSLPSLFESAPACAGVLLLHAGHAAALDPDRAEQARAWLELAAGLCQRAHSLAPTPMRAEAAWAERARQALAELARAPAAA